MEIPPGPESQPSALHLALGDHAAGCLRAACTAHGMPGDVLAIPDDLSHGPLSDGRVRLDYMRACFRGYDDWAFTTSDAFAPWHALSQLLDDTGRGPVLLWSGDNVSEASFLAMACWWLAGRSLPLLHVHIPPSDGRRHVATRTPAELAGLFASRRVLAEDERRRLAEDFTRIRDHTGLLRRWEDGRIIGVPTDRYDPLLMESCPSGWTPAARVVGTAMGRCDGPNIPSDLFFSSRLQFLIDAGRIEADGPRLRLGDHTVRRAPA